MSSVASLESEPRVEDGARRTGLSWRSRIARALILLSAVALLAWWALLAWSAQAFALWLLA